MVFFQASVISFLAAKPPANAAAPATSRQPMSPFSAMLVLPLSDSPRRYRKPPAGHGKSRPVIRSVPRDGALIHARTADAVPSIGA
ncbi:hypothetical protein GCM10022416_39040 [Actinomadura keratinilytica]|uniref:Uncharacterized protein n=1 Tax=Actinomadura keratinilytica TaxID=547461 RepID=A0ABP7Z3B6_9ACTN